MAAATEFPGYWRWITPALVLALTVYLVQLTARLAQDEALLQVTAQTVKERSPVFEQIIKIEGRLAVVEAELERRRPIIDGVTVTNEKQEGFHAAINDRIARLSTVVDRLEIQLDDLKLSNSPDFRSLRPHYSEPK